MDSRDVNLSVGAWHFVRYRGIRMWRGVGRNRLLVGIPGKRVHAWRPFLLLMGFHAVPTQNGVQRLTLWVAREHAPFTPAGALHTDMLIEQFQLAADRKLGSAEWLP